VDLSAAPGRFTVEWIHTADGTRRSAEPVAGGNQPSLNAPFTGDAVLCLRLRQEKESAR